MRIIAKSKWQEVKEKLTLVEAWARDGLTDEQIMHNLGISNYTFYEYKKKYKEFSKSLKKGKEIVDIEVENALLKKAIGYEYEEEIIDILPDGTKKRKILKKHMPADTTAQIFWLKNRKPNEWREKKEIETQVNKIDTYLDALRGVISDE